MYCVRWSTQALADLLRLHGFLLDRAETVDDLVLADQATDAIEHAVERGLSRTPMIYRRVGPGPYRRELIIPFGTTGYVALFEVLGPADVLVLAVRHQREDDYL